MSLQNWKFDLLRKWTTRFDVRAVSCSCMSKRFAAFRSFCLRVSHTTVRLHCARFVSMSDKAALCPDQPGVLKKQVAEILRGIHGAGLVHRDVSPGNPANIVVDKDGAPWLIDFGSAVIGGVAGRGDTAGYGSGYAHPLLGTRRWRAQTY